MTLFFCRVRGRSQLRIENVGFSANVCNSTRCPNYRTICASAWSDANLSATLSCHDHSHCISHVAPRSLAVRHVTSLRIDVASDIPDELIRVSLAVCKNMLPHFRIVVRSAGVRRHDLRVLIEPLRMTDNVSSTVLAFLDIPCDSDIDKLSVRPGYLKRSR